MSTKTTYNSVVYTAISGNKDLLKEIPQNLRHKMNCVAFLDKDITSISGWEVKPIRNDYKDPNRNAKYYKVLPHEVLPNFEYSLWIDGSVTPLVHVDELIDKYLGEHDWAVHKHISRNCAYKEAFVCGATGRDDPDLIATQMARYNVREGFPFNYGLCENTIILRRHTEKVKEACELWWNEIENGSRRDQLSFDFVRWKTGLEVKYMDNFVWDTPDFLVEGHIW